MGGWLHQEGYCGMMKVVHMDNKFYKHAFTHVGTFPYILEKMSVRELYHDPAREFMVFPTEEAYKEYRALPKMKKADIPDWTQKIPTK